MFVHRDKSGRIVDVTGSVDRAELERLMAEQDQAEKQVKKEAAAEAREAKKEAAAEAKKDDATEKSVPTKHAGADKPTEKSAGVSPPAKRTGR